MYSSVTILPGFVNLTHVRNTRRGLRIPQRHRLSAQDRDARGDCHRRADRCRPVRSQPRAATRLAARTGLALIIGGAAGNLIDRLVEGSVVDFVDVYWQTHHFWAFNVADSAITVGVAIMILDMLGVRTNVPKTV